MNADERGRTALALLLLAALVSASGCATLTAIGRAVGIAGPCNEQLWNNDKKHADLLRDELTGAQGYYTKDSTLQPDARKKLTEDLLSICGELAGPVQSPELRRGLEARLAPHARRYLPYVDADPSLTAQQKQDLKEPIEMWLKRIGEGH